MLFESNLKIAVLRLVVILSVSCASPGKSGERSTQFSSKQTFRYDAQTGKCIDSDSGAEGYNKVVPEKIFANLNEAGTVYETTDAQCVDFTGFDFNEFKKNEAVAFNDWDFSGALLKDASLNFVKLSNANLAGTDMRGFKFGYVEIHGSGDRFTEVGLCRIDINFKVNCRR